MNHLRLVVRGRVQGVGFRYFVLQEARALGLDGAVRNRPDGAVEVEAEGAEPVLRALIGLVRRGPSGARVDDVEERWSEGPPRRSGFQVEHP
jgi:acylphosphatase